MHRKLILFVIALVFIFSFNWLLASALGFLGRCQTSYLQNWKVKLLTNCSGFTGHLITQTLNASAITIDSHILTPDTNLPSETIQHEIGHVIQYRFLGPLFLPSYGIAHLIASFQTWYLGQTNVHARNYFEILANSIANLPPEPVY